MNFEPLKNFLDNCLPRLGIPGSDTVIFRGHEPVFRYQSGYEVTVGGATIFVLDVEQFLHL